MTTSTESHVARVPRLTSRLLVKVTQHDGTVYQLIGRSAAMAMWLAVYGEQINQTFRGTVTFEWEGPALRPQFSRKFNEIHADGSST